MPLVIDGMVAAIFLPCFRGDLNVPLLSATSLGKNKIPRVSLQLLEFFFKCLLVFRAWALNNVIRVSSEFNQSLIRV